MNWSLDLGHPSCRQVLNALVQPCRRFGHLLQHLQLRSSQFALAHYSNDSDYSLDHSQHPGLAGTGPLEGLTDCYIDLLNDHQRTPRRTGCSVSDRCEQFWPLQLHFSCLIRTGLG